MNNKNNNFLFVILVLISPMLFSQTDELIEYLQSDITYLNMAATYEIMDQNLVETYPYFLELYDSKPLEVKSVFLQALLQFHDSSIVSRTNQFIDSIDNASEERLQYLDPLLAKVKATDILFRVGVYNTVDYVFEIIERDGVENIGSYAFHLLSKIINKVPEREVEAKNILLTLWSNGSDYNRYFAMYFLTKKYGSEMIENLRSSFVSDLDLPVRTQALEYLILLDKDNLDSLLRTRFVDDPEWSFRTKLVDTLLAYYGLPSDLKSVIDYQPTEPNETARSLMGYAIQYFIPPRPTVTTAEMIENLIAYNNELYQYGWITDSSNYLVYKGYLEAIQSSYAAQSLVDICANLNNLLTLAESQHGGPLLTEEGYKFLYYHGTYIKVKIESELGSCVKKGKK